jgi:branched-subunit amino acid aminotransferase/4-amino-4-deoxychorismate lyase
MVTTFELIDRTAQRTAEHAGMSAASAALPAGAYTTFRTYDHNRVVRLAQHFRRLEESASLMRQRGTIDDVVARHVIASIIAQMGYDESRFRLTFAPPRLFISIEPFTPYAPALYEAGVRCVTVSLHRNTPHAKSTTFIASAADAYRALPAGAHEGLMIATDGSVLEGLSSNFFALLPSPKGGGVGGGEGMTLHTEESRVLIGVTRSLVLEVAQGVLPIATQAVKVNDLPEVRECFITSVSREIMPVVKIDHLTIGDGTPGPITRELMRRFHELVAREAMPLT